MARKTKKPRNLKKEASDTESRYVRLRDALDYCKRMGIDTTQFSRIEDLPVKCCTCITVKSWIYMQAGHYYSRGLGGGSGAYFDERNINTQCPICNSFEGGNIQAYREFMLIKYNQRVLDELEILHRAGKKRSDLDFIALKEYFTRKFEELTYSLTF